MIILRGLECKRQDYYCNLNKTYEFEVLFNFKTDTYDILGMLLEKTNLDYNLVNNFIKNKIKNYIGIYKQKYPPYSSYCINGKPLWLLSKENKNVEIPNKEIEIYDLDFKGFYIITHNNLYDLIFNKIHSLNINNFKNFRVNKILNKWKMYFENNFNKEYFIYKFKTNVSSGTYIRDIVNRMGNDLNIGATAFDINRVSFDIDI